MDPIQLIKEYGVKGFEDLDKLPLTDEEKSAMHSQLKVDEVYRLKYANYLKGLGEFNMDSLIKQFGNPSNLTEINMALDIDKMNKGLK